MPGLTDTSTRRVRQSCQVGLVSWTWVQFRTFSLNRALIGSVLPPKVQKSLYSLVPLDHIPIPCILLPPPPSGVYVHHCQSILLQLGPGYQCICGTRPVKLVLACWYWSLVLIYAGFILHPAEGFWPLVTYGALWTLKMGDENYYGILRDNPLAYYMGLILVSVEGLWL